MSKFSEFLLILIAASHILGSYYLLRIAQLLANRKEGDRHE